MKKLLYLSAVLLASCGEQTTTQVQSESVARDSGTAANKPKPLATTQVSETELDRMNGFGNVHFGDTPDKLKGAKEDFRTGPFATYAQHNQVKHKNHIDGESIFWEFKDNRLVGVMYVVNGAGIKPFMEAFHARFGEPTMRNDTMFWHGRTVSALANVRAPGYNPHNTLDLDPSKEKESTLVMRLKKLQASN
ncbi:hypothetical protein [Hymenobacter persicinus]|uniref:Uncharacterized protein n=1 Tax=Hymenobacter persicinus TaxID=2025506 RepID=A0A4Q5L8D7_9BACT|nr:hypothetical protein [Hymenobacter persicinus]RYU77680.1 hypothetical protein EWM57_17295 [Hymenobacter persicinus]